MKASPPYVVRAERADEVAVALNGRTYVLLSARSPNRVLEPILLVVEPTRAAEEPYARDGEEFLYVLSGEIVYRFADREYRLGPGDSIHLGPHVQHTIVNDTNEQARAIVVLTERFF